MLCWWILIGVVVTGLFIGILWFLSQGMPSERGD
jgi:hypothetical protein